MKIKINYKKLLRKKLYMIINHQINLYKNHQQHHMIHKMMILNLRELNMIKEMIRMLIN